MSKKFEIDGEQFTVDFFDVTNLQKGCTVLMLGKRNSGKTEDVIKLLKTVHPNDTGYVITDEKTEHIYLTELPSVKVKTSVSDVELNNIINDVSVQYIVLDCVLNLYSYIDLIKTTFEATNKTKIVVQQFSYSMSKVLQQKIDYIFVHNDCFYTNHLRIHQYYMNFISTFNTFQQLMKMLTLNYDAIVIDKKDCNKLYWFNSKTEKLVINYVNDTVNENIYDVDKIETETVIYSDFIDNTHFKIEDDFKVKSDENNCIIL